MLLYKNIPGSPGGGGGLVDDHLKEVVVIQGASDERGNLRPHPEHVSHRGVDHHVHVPLRRQHGDNRNGDSDGDDNGHSTAEGIQTAVQRSFTY